MSAFHEFSSVQRTVAMAALLALSACGGGSGGGSTSSQASTATVSGVASKGLLKNAIVTAYAVDASGAATSTVLASDRTSPTGTYSLPGLPPGAVVYIEVTADAATRMLDETAPGEITPEPGFKLRAVTVLDSNATTLQVTPFSDMAVAVAQGSLGFTKEVVQAANEQIVEFAGNDVLHNPPTFDSNNKPTNPAGLLLAAVAEMARNGSLGCTGTQAAKVKCVVEGLAAAGPSDAGLVTALDAAQTAAKPVTYAGTVPSVAVQPAELPIKPEVQSVVDSAKALVASVRNIGMTLSRNTNADLRPRLQAVVDAVETSVTPLDESVLAALGVAEKTVTILEYPQEELGTFPAGGQFSYLAVGNVPVGCTFYSDSAFAIPATSYANAGSAGCRVTHKVVPASGGNLAYAIQHRVRVTKQSSNHYVVSTALVKQTGSVSGSQFTKDSSNPVAVGSSALSNEATVVRVVSGSTYSGLTLVGALAPGVTLAEQAIGTRSAVDIAVLSSSQANGITRLSLKGLLSLYDGETVLSSIKLKDGSYAEAKTTVVGDATSSLSTDESGRTLHLLMEGVATGGAKVTGTLDASDFVHNAVRWGPTKGSFAGVVTEPDGTTLFDGALTLTMPTDPESQYLGWTAKLDGTVLVSGTGSTATKLTLNLLLTHSATVVGDGSFSGRYTQGTNTFLIEGRAFDATPSRNTLSFSGLSGVTFTTHPNDDSEVAVILVKGTATIAKFTRGDSKVVYADGSYEQL